MALWLSGRSGLQVIKMDSLLKWSHHTWCTLQRKEHTKLDVNGKEFFEMKERLQYNERMLLQTIGFDCDIVKTGFKVSSTGGCAKMSEREK